MNTALEISDDGGIKLVSVDSDTTIVSLPASFIMGNGLLSDNDADWFENSQQIADVICALLDVKGYTYDASRVASITERCIVPGAPYDPADFLLAIEVTI